MPTSNLLPGTKNAHHVHKNSFKKSRGQTHRVAARQNRHRKLRDSIRKGQIEFARIVGEPIHIELERARELELIDHVWITLDIEDIGPIRATISTRSRRNELAGFDSRIRLGSITESWEKLPEQGVFHLHEFSYDTLEKEIPVTYTYYGTPDMESILIEKSGRATRIEIWGALYAHHHIGIHNVHAMTASCAVPEEAHNRDGAIKLYYPDKTSELLLLKFCGQR